MITLATESPAPVGNFAALRKQAALRFFFLVGTPFFIWVLARMEWPVQTAAQLLKALTYWVMQFEVWLSAPAVSVPLMVGAAVLWLALTTQSVLGLAELDAADAPNEGTVAKALVVYQRGRIVENTLVIAALGAVVLALLSWAAKVIHDVTSNEALTVLLGMGLIAMGFVMTSPLANIVLPKALRQPWNTVAGEIHAEAALRFFGDSPWSTGEGSTSWSLSQYRKVLLYNLARRAGALDQVRHALGMDTASSTRQAEEASD